MEQQREHSGAPQTEPAGVEGMFVRVLSPGIEHGDPDGQPGYESLETPAWFLKLVREKATPEAMVSELKRRALVGEDLHVLKMLANLVGRARGGGMAIAREFSVEFLFELSREER